ncbi:MAG: fibronectin type III domain-containing protein [Defluviitaleaceae bacterium]|nr:fibronectin type III domain-containing protein [Defluviitaleaceae bacterium]
MKKLTSKIIAAFLVFVMVLAYIPPVPVFANVQNPVRDLSINGLIPPPPADNMYNINLSWNLPIIANPLNMSPVPSTNFNNHQAPHAHEGYDIVVRNLSTTQAITTPWPVTPALSPADTNRSLMNIPDTIFLPARIYGLSTVPFHTHIHMIPGPGGILVPDPRRVVPANNPEVLFLTDIPVELDRGPQGGIMVSWINPRAGATQIFSGYELHYWRRGETFGANAPIIVTPTLADRTTTINGERWMFEITDPSLQIGTFYHVRVVPLIGVSPFVPFMAGQVASVSLNDIPHQIARSHRQFEANDFYLAPRLVVTPEGSRDLRLNWDSVLSTGSPLGYVRRAEIWSFTTPQDEDWMPSVVDGATLILTIAGTPGAEIITRHFVTPRPNVRTWYVVVFHFSNGDIMMTNHDDFDPTFNDFKPYSPMIRDIFHVGNQPPNLALDITWRAFTREPYTVLEREFAHPERGFLDQDVVYYVFITDELDLLHGEDTSQVHGSAMTPVARLPATGLSPLVLDILSSNPLRQDYFFRSQFNQYVNRSGELRFLEDNKVYYVKIIAVRTIAYEEHHSRPAFASVYIPPGGDISLIPQMVPVRIKENAEGVQVITENSIAIQWDLRWYEVFNPATNSWYNIVGVNPSGDLVFGSDALRYYPNVIRLWDERYTLAPTESLARARINEDLSIASYSSPVTIRLMDVSDVDYQIHVVEYAIMNAIGSYEDYFDSLLGQPPGIWQNIGRGNPSDTSNQREFTVTTSHMPSGALQENTSYVIFFRPINPAGPAHFPTWVSGTTLMPRPPLDIIPTVPILEVVGVTDTSVRLRWNGSFEFDYELYFSQLLTDYPEGAGRIGISSQQIRDYNVVNDVDGQSFIYFTVTGLFPNTLYHFWVRAVNELGTPSAWSNPVSATTLDIQPPEPPAAIMLASATSLQAYNTENNTNWQRGMPNNLIIEWMRIFADLNNPFPATVIRDYAVTGGEGSWLDSPSLSATYMALFDELVANRRHYVRARTWLTITRGADGVGIVRSYSYEVQLASNNQFLDPITIIIPGMADFITAPGQMRRLESRWSDTFSFFSGQTEDEYDGGVNADLFPLPDQDFEFIYTNGTLVYRFRSNQIDQWGNRDNLVDERFISRLVQNRVFTFDVDVSVWGAYPVNTRVVEIPMGIIQAFDERQIDLRINAGNLTLTIPHGSLVTNQVRNTQGFNRFTRGLITLTQVNTPATGVAPALASAPHTLTVEFIEGLNTVAVTEFAKPIIVEMTLPSAHDPSINNVRGYLNNWRTGGWQAQTTAMPLPAARLPGVPQVIPATPPMASFNTVNAGTYTIISTPPTAPATGVVNETLDAMQRVNSQLRITDMGAFNENTPVHPSQFNQIVAAAALRRETVQMNAAMDQRTFTSLGRSGMLISGGTVSRQAGISSLVRLYETRTRAAVSWFPTAAESSMPDIGTAAAQFRTNLLKAEALGFYRGTTINPNDPMTFGDLMFILDIILSN